MTKIFLHFSFLVLFILPLSGQNIQNSSNIWYFGDRAGLDFNTSPPTALTDGQINTQEGVASVSDNNGDLLFYTDGSTIWDRSHQAMPNADGNLNGHWSSSQSAIIVPNLSAPNIYYVFTVDELGGGNGLSYTIVDLSLAGNGSIPNPLGNAVSGEINIQLVSPVTEKIVGVLKPDYSGYWIVAHGWNNNSFYAYEINCSGLNTEPVISNIGNVHTGGSGNINAVGYMKASIDGQKLALVNRNSGTIDVYDFDNSTGVVSNEFEIKPNDPLIYGLEFSFNGDYLYIGGEHLISQYSFLTNILTNISVDNPSALSGPDVVRALQLGPDENIYVSVRNRKYLSAIYNPESNDPLLTTDAVYLDPDNSGRNCRFGLPNIFYFDLVDLDSLTIHACPNDQVEYNGEFYDTGTTNEINLIGANGCDSTIILVVEAFQVVIDILEVNACEGDFYNYNGTQIPTGSQQDFVFPDVNGCDSTLTVIVDAFDVNDETIEVKACEGSFYDYNGTQIPTGSQQDFVFPDINGCDSTVTVVVDAFDVNDETIEVKACEGSFYDYNGTQIPTGSQQDFVFPDVNGCDSTVTVVVDAFEINYELLNVDACEGSFYDYNGTQIPAGTQQDFIFMDQNGCDSTVSVNVNSLSNPVASAIAQEMLTCANNNITISGNGSTGNGPLLYDWTFNGTSIGMGENISVSEPGFYILIVTDNAGCSGETQVEVFQDIEAPTALITFSGEISCTGSSVSLDGGGSTGNGTLSFNWMDENGNSVGNGVTINVNIAGEYILNVTDNSNGCTATDIATVEGDEGTSIGNFVFQDGNQNGIQEPWEAGVANVIVELYSLGPDNLYNTNDDVLIEEFTTGNNGEYLFECMVPDVYYLKYNIDTGQYTFSPPNQGTNDELDSDADPLSGLSNAFTISQGMPHDYSFDAGIHSVCDDYTYGGTIGQNQIICPGDEPETLHSILPPSGGSGTPEYLWLKSTNGSNWSEIPNADEESYNPGPLYTTSYFIRCIRREGCTSFIVESANQAIITVLSEDDDYCVSGNMGSPPSDSEQLSEIEDQIIQIYPNPVSNEFYIQSRFKNETSLYLCNSLGKIIQVINVDAGESSKMINLNNFSEGIYFIHFPKDNDNDFQYLKIIKQ